ncbi:CAMK family protein kinase [Tritrichomonas foetus]|uniref:CAMK family protein kinase n=1 Tax=Tritrichomonas foetus TaxID=1144522 RepID=A0A1J4JIP5_9EUKA|nr:CAMK family protein kinase [Tritrichomonas foetus]|eukprot:OHS97419.1 CAMK family protein kinase [Tritrichomonas foetus]
MNLIEFQDTKETLLDHGYKLVREIGKGASAIVFLAYSERYQCEFAIKRVDINKTPLASRQQVSLEINALIRLNHPFIIKMFEIFVDDKAMYIVFEYCPGGSLRNLKNDHSFNIKQFWMDAKNLLEVLKFCHQRNIAHRDIKPENIFIDKYGRVRLADFGLSQLYNDGDKVRMCGSLMYMSPELVDNNCKDPFAADIWSLGLTFLFMVTGKLPFSFHTREEFINAIKAGMVKIPQEVPAPIYHMIRRMTTVNPNMRPSAAELLDSIEQFKDIKPAFETTNISILSSRARMATTSRPLFKNIPRKCSENNTIKVIPKYKKVKAFIHKSVSPQPLSLKELVRFKCSNETFKLQSTEPNS